MARGKLIVIDGLPCCGRSTLADFLARATGCPWMWGSTDSQDVFDDLLERLATWQDGPLIVCEFHLNAAVAMVEGRNDLTAEQWAVLDKLAEDSDGRVLCMVDNPVLVEERLREERRTDYMPRQQIGKHLNQLTLALHASNVRKKGTYRLQQFLSLETGKTTPMFDRLAAEIRSTEEQ